MATAIYVVSLGDSYGCFLDLKSPTQSLQCSVS